MDYFKSGGLAKGLRVVVPFCFWSELFGACTLIIGNYWYRDSQKLFVDWI